MVSSDQEETSVTQPMVRPVFCAACNGVVAYDAAIKVYGPEQVFPAFTARQELYACSEACRPAVEAKVPQ
jgi:hypothetical protein